MTAERPIPLDEYPIHQVPLSMRYVASSDRHAYDRTILQVFDHDGEAVLIVGLGVYPNVGVIDAFATLTHGGRQHVVRASDALSEDRLAQAVGPLRIEVEEPLRRIRLVCDAPPGEELSFDVAWQARSPAVWEPHHVMRTGDKQILDGRRFVQGGQASGMIRLGDREFVLEPGEWSATRDRSWGIRATGGGEPPSRFSAESDFDGMWWLWLPMQFDDHFIVVIAQEDGDGFRTLNEAIRVWDPELGRPDEKLGWPLVDVTYRPGTRYPTAASVQLIDADRRPFTIAVEPLLGNPISLGAGYPPDPEWSHGQWMGRGFVERKSYDLADPVATGHTAFGPIDHSARVRYDGNVGWGIFEHFSIGRHRPSGMADLGSVAP